MWKYNLKMEHVLEWVSTEMEGRDVYKLNPTGVVFRFNALGASELDKVKKPLQSGMSHWNTGQNCYRSLQTQFN